MSLSEKMPLPKFSVASPNRAVKSIRDRLATGSVEWSTDLARVLALPRRPKPDLGPLVDQYTLRLRKPEGTMVLRPIQAWGLHELETVGGLLGPIGIGAGKTLIGMLAPMVTKNCQRAVLLLPPDLRVQFHHEWPEYAKHWRLPNLAGGTSFVDDGRPVLHVVAYSELSGTKNSNLLEDINPDAIFGDEIQCLASFLSARSKRLLRFFANHSATRFGGWTGTMTSDSPDDYAHFGFFAIGAGSPLPI